MEPHFFFQLQRNAIVGNEYTKFGLAADSLIQTHRHLPAATLYLYTYMRIEREKEIIANDLGQQKKKKNETIPRRRHCLMGYKR